jgi:hypothetical protein
MAQLLDGLRAAASNMAVQRLTKPSPRRPKEYVPHRAEQIKCEDHHTASHLQSVRDSIQCKN